MGKWRQILAAHKEVAPHALHGCAAGVQYAHLVAFAVAHHQLAQLLVVVANVQITEFAGADAGGHQHHHDGIVASCSGAQIVGNGSVAHCADGGLTFNRGEQVDPWMVYLGASSLVEVPLLYTLPMEKEWFARATADVSLVVLG